MESTSSLERSILSLSQASLGTVQHRKWNCFPCDTLFSQPARAGGQNKKLKEREARGGTHTSFVTQQHAACENAFPVSFNPDSITI
jgi:hypothetical protein